MKLYAHLKGYGAIPDIKSGDTPTEEELQESSSAVAAYSRPWKKVLLAMCLSSVMVAGSYYTYHNTTFIDSRKEPDYLISAIGALLNDSSDDVDATGERYSHVACMCLMIYD